MKTKELFVCFNLPPSQPSPTGEGAVTTSPLGERKREFKNRKLNMGYSTIISKAKQNFGADLNIRSKARELRKNMTKPEKSLWNLIRNRQMNGLHFRRQHPYGIYILDFYCFKANLVIEIDGLIHLKQLDYDNERTRYLESSGLKVLRFENKDIENRIDWVLDEIRSYLVESPSSQPSATRGGAEANRSPLGEIRKGFLK